VEIQSDLFLNMTSPDGSSWLKKFGESYSMLWKMIIRPPRDVYSVEELGPQKFRIGMIIYERRDLQIKSSRGHILECSHFVPARRSCAQRPCIVYLHGNCSSRLEAFDVLPVLLPRDLTVFSLDLSGSGLSEGEYISLGYHEERDLHSVLAHLRENCGVTSIGLWGRSMGAVTAILCTETDPGIAACVLDSPFGDFRTVAEELVGKGMIPCPRYLLNVGFDLIRNEVLERANFDPNELRPLRSAPKARCPAFFGVAQDDHFVLPHHTQDLHDAWAVESVLRVFDGGHNGLRPSWFLEEAATFLLDRLNEGVSSNDAKSGGDVVPDPGDIAEQLVNMGFTASAVDVASSLGGKTCGPSCSSKKPAPFTGQLGENDCEGTGSRGVKPQQCEVQDFPGCDEMDEQLHRSGALMTSGDIPLNQAAVVFTEMVANIDDGVFALGFENMRPPVKGARVADHLLYLGFREQHAEEASRRALSVQDAVDYLASQHVVVKL